MVITNFQFRADRGHHHAHQGAPGHPRFAENLSRAMKRLASLRLTITRELPMPRSNGSSSKCAT